MTIADDLNTRGWSVQENYFQAPLITALHKNLESSCNLMKQAGIGRGSAFQVQADIRNDKTLWLDGTTAAQADYLGLMDQLRNDLNKALFLGLHDFEAHYALYEPGGFYKKHLDALKGQRNRVISTVTYLTPDWTEQDKGYLVLYNESGDELTRILPCAGTLAIFLSEDIPHEVLPPQRARRSIAGWYRVRA